MTENVGGYLQVGLALIAVVMPVALLITFVGLFVLYGLIIVGAIASVGAGAAIGDATNDRDLGGIVSGLGTMGSVLCSFVGFFGIMALGTAAIAPVSASVTRSIAAHQRGEGELTFQGAFSSIRQDMGANIAVVFLMMSLTLVGVMFCYVGALVPAFLFTFAVPMVAVGRVSALTALTRTARGAMARPMEHAAYAGAYFVTALVANYVPILGHAFLLALQVRAYRKVYGDAALTPDQVAP
jgi:hypothetical protein